MRHAVVTYRSQQHAHELPVAPASNNEKVRPTRGFDQYGSRMTLDNL